LLSEATAYKVLGAAHPLRVLLTSFSKEVGAYFLLQRK